MGCSGCSVGSDGKPGGCQSNGGCSTGGCNRLNTFDWLATMDIYDPAEFDVVEVSFKNGARKAFFRNQPHTNAITGDLVVVEAGGGYDVGKISLMGELVRMQMKKKKVGEESVMLNVIRRANHRDIERLDEARSQEVKTMVKARAIARTLDLDMKIGDVEYQGDKRKATFFYTAEGRVDFRELIRHFAKEFKVKVEMRQIGARQESARIGGIGSCGRELCCSTWLSDFKSVSTAAARYQNLAINQAKLSGQCGRLKCCLNYELDTYMDALEAFPKDAEHLTTEVGRAVLVKTDIFKGIMYYVYESGKGRGKFYPLKLDRVKEIRAKNKKGEIPLDLIDLHSLMADSEDEVNIDFEGDVTGVIELPPEERRRRKKKGRGNRNKKKPSGSGGNQNRNKGAKQGTKPSNKQSKDQRRTPNNQKKKEQGKGSAQASNSNAKSATKEKGGTNPKPKNKSGNRRRPNRNNKKKTNGKPNNNNNNNNGNKS